MSNGRRTRGRKFAAPPQAVKKKGKGVEPAHDPYIVPAVDRAIRLLMLMAQEKREMTLAELTARLDLPHATAFRLAHTLESHGLLRRKPMGYEVGPRILTLGFEYLSSLDIVGVARGELTRLRDATGASANLGILDGFEVLYLCHIPSLRPLGSRVEVGSRMPAHGSSIGRVLLAALPVEELTSRYRGTVVVELADCANTLDALIAQAKEDRARGWVLKHGVFERDLVAIAAPILDVSGEAVAAVNISGPISAMLADGVAASHTNALLTAARRISSQLGYAR